MLPANYLELPYDLSGSTAKSRFRNELLWGVDKLLEIYNSYDEFAIVFDYVSDIEVHTLEQSQYYQVKTKKESRPCTINYLCSQGKAKDGGALPSILGKLYNIRIAHKNDELPIAIVSNNNLKHEQKEYTETLSVQFTSLEDSAQKAIRKALAIEFPSHTICLRNISFIRSTIDLFQPSDTIKGRLVSWFPLNKGCEVFQPYALYQSIYVLVTEKACYELKCLSNEEVLNKKAITKAEFDRIISSHMQNSSTGITSANRWIQYHYQHCYSERNMMLKSLGTIVEYRSRDRRLQMIENQMSEYIDDHLAEFNRDGPALLEQILELSGCNLPSPYSIIEARVLILLILMRREELLCCS